MKISANASHDEIDWAKFKYMAFDVMNHSGSYAERYSHLGPPLHFSLSLPLLPHSLTPQIVNSVDSSECKYVEVAAREVCSDIQHLERYLQDVIDKGGEGIILRDPSAPYEPGRSRHFLKHKVC